MVSRIKEIIFLTSVFVLTIIFHLYYFHLPPLWADETSNFIMGLSLIENHNSDLYHYSMLWGAHIGNLPIAWQHYNSNVLATYLAVPFLYFIGVNVDAVRAYDLVVTMLVLFLTYYFAKELYSRRIGIISVSLLSILPSFVFYSRQSTLYDWLDLCIALLAIIYGLRYVRSLKSSYLFVSLFLLGIGTYEYLWFGWILFGLILSAPLWIKKIHFNLKFILTSIIAISVGFSYLLIEYIVIPSQSLIPFIISTISGNSSDYTHPNNENFIGNFLMRLGDLSGFLSKPAIAFEFFNSNHVFDDVNYVFLILFIMATIICLIWVFKKRDTTGKTKSLLVLVLGIVLASVFTISELLPIQISIILPFVMIIIAKGIDLLISYFVKSSVSINRIMPIIIGGLLLTQIPTLINGYDAMTNSSTAETESVYHRINSYVLENNLRPVSLDFFTAKVLPFYSNGTIVPVVMQWTLPQINELNKFREPMPTIDSMDLKLNYIFLYYSYPNYPNCSNPSFEQKPVCGDIQFIENYAKKNHRSIQKIEFNFTDGTPFVSGLVLS